MKIYKINLEKIMSKKIARSVVAGGILMNLLEGGMSVGAYEGQTNYPENIKAPIIITEVDVRNNKISAFFNDESRPGAVFKGIGVFEGEVDDGMLNSFYPREDTGVVKYLEYTKYNDNWEETENGVEKNYTMEEDLGENTAGTLSFYYLFLNNPDNPSLNIHRGRINYRSCVESEGYQENKEAICRMELWSDGWLHYVPYMGWERLSNEGEGLTKFVYKDGAWQDWELVKLVKLVEVPIVDATSEMESEIEVERVEYVEKIVEVVREVPVEKRVEVPLEKKVEVPIEKKVTEIKEVIREVPVLASILTENQSVEDELTLESGVEEEVEVQAVEETEDNEQKNREEEQEIELPDLGREVESEKWWASKIAIFSAGVVSALSLLILAVVFKKKKQKNQVR